MGEKKEHRRVKTELLHQHQRHEKEEGQSGVCCESDSQPLRPQGRRKETQSNPVVK